MRNVVEGFGSVLWDDVEFFSPRWRLFEAEVTVEKAMAAVGCDDLERMLV